MKKIMKNSFVPCILAALVGMVMMTGCNEKFKWDLPLSLAQRAINLAKEGGSTHVLVYSTGDWTLSFTEEGATWAAIDRIKGSGNGEFVFSYTTNYDYERSIGVIVTSGSLKDTVVFTQAGSLSSPSYKLSLDEVELLKSPETISIPVSSTNVLYDFSFFNVVVTYYDADGHTVDVVTVDTKGEDDIDYEDEVLKNWIHNVKITAEEFMFDVTLNTLPYTRKALVMISISTGSYNYDSSLNVAQTAGGPVFVLDSEEGGYDSQARSVIVSASYNNMALYADKVAFTVTYPDGSGSAEEWIQNPTILATGLSFSLTQNETEAERHGVISYSYTDSIGESISGTYSVTQSAE